MEENSIAVVTFQSGLFSWWEMRSDTINPALAAVGEMDYTLD
jgi:hypothetical protein